jgi:hypothetical protein
MKPRKQDWQYRLLDEERLAIIEAALPDAIDLAAMARQSIWVAYCLME